MMGYVPMPRSHGGVHATQVQTEVSLNDSEESLSGFEVMLIDNHLQPAMGNLRQAEMEEFKLTPNLNCFHPICCVPCCTPL